MKTTIRYSVHNLNGLTARDRNAKRSATVTELVSDSEARDLMISEANALATKDETITWTVQKMELRSDNSILAILDANVYTTGVATQESATAEIIAAIADEEDDEFAADLAEMLAEDAAAELLDESDDLDDEERAELAAIVAENILTAIPAYADDDLIARATSRKSSKKVTKELRPAKVWNLHGVAGLVKSKKSQITKTKVEMWNCEQAGMNTDGGQWALKCEHGATFHFAAYRDARDNMAQPFYCEVCQNIAGNTLAQRAERYHYTGKKVEMMAGA